MNYIASHITSKIIQQVNSRRIQLQNLVLWPDHEIMQFMQSDFDIQELPNKCSAINIVCKKINAEDLSSIIKDNEHTHFACKKNSQSNMLDVVLTTRSIAIDEIKFYDRSCYSAWFRILQISSKEHLWGCEICSQNGVQIVITPAQMSKKRNLIEFEIDKVKIQNTIIFYGTQRQPRYGRKIYDGIIPEHAFVIYQTKIQQLNSFLDSMILKEQPSFDYTIKFSNQQKSDAIKKVMKPSKISQIKRQLVQSTYIANDIPNKSISKSLKSSKHSIKILHQQNILPIQPTRKNIFEKQQVNQLKQKYLNKYANQFQQTLPEQYENNFQFPEKQSDYIRLQSTASNAELAISKKAIKRFISKSKENQISPIITETHYLLSQDCLDVLHFLNSVVTKKCFQEEIEKLQLNELFKIQTVCSELCLETIPQLSILFGVLNKIDAQNWIDIYKWSFQYQKMNNKVNEISEILKQKVQQFFIYNSRQILEKAHSVFYAKLLQIQEQEFLQLLYKAIKNQQPFNYQYVVDVLSLLIEHFSLGKSVLDLLVKSTNSTIQQNQLQFLGYQNNDGSLIYNYIQDAQPDKKNMSVNTQKLKIWQNKSIFEKIKYIEFSLLFDQQGQLQNEVKTSSTFKFDKDQFQLIMVKKQTNKLIVFIKYITKSSNDIQYCSSNCQLNLSWRQNQKNIKTTKSIYFSWSPGNHYFPGVVFQLSTDKSVIYNISIAISRNLINQFCLHYVTLKAQDIFEINKNKSEILKKPRSQMERISQQMNRRRSQQILTKNILKQMDNFHIDQTSINYGQAALFELSPVILFCLFQTEKLYITNENLLLHFASKYLALSTHKFKEIIILPIRFSDIPLDQIIAYHEISSNLGTKKFFINKAKKRINKAMMILMAQQRIQHIDLHRRIGIQKIRQDSFNSVVVIEWLQKNL